MAQEPIPFTYDNDENSDPAEFWERIFARFRAADVPDDFMRDRPMNEPFQERDVFGEDVPER